MFHPRNPGQGSYFKESWKKAGKATRQLHFDHLGTYFFFQNFSGSGAGFATEIAAGRGKIGRQAARAGVGTNIIFSKPHRKPAKLTVVIHSTDKEKEIQRGEATFPRSRSL